MDEINNQKGAWKHDLWALWLGLGVYLMGQRGLMGLEALKSSNWAKIKQSGPNLTNGLLMDENPLKLGIN